MSAALARLMLKSYALAGSALYPFMGPYLRRRARRGKEDLSRRRERYGHPGMDRPPGPLVWLHAAGASGSEAVSGLAARLAGLGITVLFTTAGLAGERVVRERLDDRVIHRFAPLDLKPAVARFLDHWKPDLALVAASEIWPVMTLELGKRHIPQIVVDGHLSERSFAAWSKRRFFASALTEHFAHVLARDEEAMERFSDLGARPVTIAGNMAVEAALPMAAPQTGLGARMAWLVLGATAADGEPVARLHDALAKRLPGLVTVVSARDASDGAALAARLGSPGRVMHHAGDGIVLPEGGMILLDADGSRGLALMAEVGIVHFGSGIGQAPAVRLADAARFGAAMLCGPALQAGDPLAEALIGAGALRPAADLRGLGNMLAGFLTRPETATQAGEAAKAVIASRSGALDVTLSTLAPWINPLVLSARLASGQRNGASHDR